MNSEVHGSYCKDCETQLQKGSLANLGRFQANSTSNLRKQNGEIIGESQHPDGHCVRLGSWRNTGWNYTSKPARFHTYRFLEPFITFTTL